MRWPGLALIPFLLDGSAVLAHGKEKHDAEAAAPPAASELPAEPFPFEIGGGFELVDHEGRVVTDRDFRGRHLLVFFGYANCEGICPVGLRRMTAALDLLGERAAGVQPLLITVDPKYDTVETLAEHVPKIHPRLIGLTGTPAQLAAAAKAYHVESTEVGKSLKTGKPILNHGSYIYLMGPDGGFQTLLPPVLDPATMAKTIGKYL